MLLPKCHRRERPGQPVGKPFKVTTAKFTVLPMMARVVRSSLILTLLVAVWLTCHSTAHSSPLSLAQSSRFSWHSSQSESSTLRLTLSAAPCTLDQDYQTQPTAECQGVYDLHRVTVYLIAASAIQVLLLAFIAIMQFRSR